MPPLPPLLYRQDLDAAICDVPDCTYVGHDPLVLQAPCHPRAGFAVQYHTGVLLILCQRCQRPVTRVAVQAQPEEPAHQ